MVFIRLGFLQTWEAQLERWSAGLPRQPRGAGDRPGEVAAGRAQRRGSLRSGDVPVGPFGRGMGPQYLWGFGVTSKATTAMITGKSHVILYALIDL